MNVKKLLALLLALVMTLTMASALADTITVNVLPPVVEETVAEETSADPVLATVNGQPILQSAVDGYALNFYYYYTNNGYNLTDEDLLYLRQMGLEYAVQMAVLEQKGIELGVLPLSEETVVALTEENHTSWEEAVSYYMAGFFGVNNESTEEQINEARINTLALLESMGYTEAAELANTLQNESYNLVSAHVTKDAVVSDEDVQNAYALQVAQDEAKYKDNIYVYEVSTLAYGMESTYTPEGYRGVIQILLPVDEALLTAYNEAMTALDEAAATATDLDDSLKANAEAAAQAALAYVQPTYDEIVEKFNSGVSFQELIAEYNTDPGMTNPDTLANGYMVHKDSVVWDASFVQAAMSLDSVGQMSTPYVGSYGAYVVYYLRDVPAGAAPLSEEKAAALRAAALEPLQHAMFNGAMEAWLAEAAVEYTELGQTYLVTEDNAQ